MALFSKKKILEKEKKNASGSGCEGSNCTGDVVTGSKVVQSTTAGTVKILGSGCAKCATLETNTKAALEQLGMDSTIDHVTDFAQIASYVKSVRPGLWSFCCTGFLRLRGCRGFLPASRISTRCRPE